MTAQRDILAWAIDPSAFDRSAAERAYTPEAREALERRRKAAWEKADSIIALPGPVGDVACCPECGDTSPLPECATCGGYPQRRIDRHPGWTEAGHAWLDAGAPIPIPPALGEDDDLEALARTLFWADIQYDHRENPMPDEWRDKWWDEWASSPLSGKAFVGSWKAIAAAARRALLLEQGNGGGDGQ